MTTIPEDVIERAAEALLIETGRKFVTAEEKMRAWYCAKAVLRSVGYLARLKEIKRLKEEVERLRAELDAKEPTPEVVAWVDSFERNPALPMGDELWARKVTGPDACSKCKGTGFYLGPRMVWKQTCHHCNGTGRAVTETTDG